MRVVRVQKRSYGGIVVHALLDPERTFCGRKPAELDVVEELELDKLPALEGCNGCRRALDGWTPPARIAPAELRIVAPPAPGRLRTTGSLSHGTRVKRGGRRLA